MVYIRQDQPAIDYRDFIDYALSVRPNLSSIVGDNNKSNIASTILQYIMLDIPKEMTTSSLLVVNK